MKYNYPQNCENFYLVQIKIMKALEDDSDFRLKTLKENDMDNKDIEEIKTRLKVSFCILNFVIVCQT